MARKQCCFPFVDEFKKENFSFAHQPYHDFCKSQWQTTSRCIWWVIYRWFSIVFFASGVCVAFSLGWNSPLWFIYFTNWGYSLCLLTSLYGAIICTIYYIKPDHFSNNCCSLKLYWFCYWLTVVSAISITTVYWSTRFTDDSNERVTICSIWTHVINSALMLLDYMLIAFPTRLLHFVYPFSLGVLYAIFSVIYYKANGVNVRGRHYIYRKLDWSKPGWAMFTTLGCLLVTMIFTVVLFGLYKIRICLYHKRLSKSESLVAG